MIADRARESLARLAAVPALGGVLLLGGCAGGAMTSSEPVSLPPYAARVTTMPPAPPVVGVLEQRSGRTVTQQIVLRTAPSVSGQNRIEVTARPGKPMPIDPVALNAQLAAAAPMALRPSGRAVSNAYGPFGYAAGRRGGIGCIYAWQSLPVTGGGLGGQTLDIRVRICAPGASESRLVAMAAAISVSGAPGAAYGVPAAGGAYGVPAYGTPAYGAGGAYYADDAAAAPQPRRRTVYRTPAAQPAASGAVYSAPAQGVTAAPVRTAPAVANGQAGSPAALPENVRPTGPLKIEPPLGMPTTLQDNPAAAGTGTAGKKAASKPAIVPLPPAPPSVDGGTTTTSGSGTSSVPAP